MIDDRPWIPAVVALSLGCGEPVVEPELTEVAPAVALEGESVVISGMGFLHEDSAKGSRVVLTDFPGVKNQQDITDAVDEWSDTEVSFEVPSGLADHAYVIYVVSEGEWSNGLQFEVVLPPDPAIDALDPPAGQAGDPIAIRGSQLGDDAGRVLFWPDVPGSVTAWTDMEIVVEVPKLSSSDSLRVERADGFLSPWFPFAVADPNLASLSLIQATIFTPRCTLGPCHGTGTAPMTLLEGDSHGNLVSVESSQLPGAIRVIPSRPDESLLIGKLENAMPAVGSQMPLDADPLAQEQIDLIREWIDRGAPDD